MKLITKYKSGMGKIERELNYCKSRINCVQLSVVTAVLYIICKVVSMDFDLRW
jgi:hypothetical protein